MIKSPMKETIHSDGAERSFPVKVQNKNKPDPSALKDIHPVEKISQFNFIIFYFDKNFSASRAAIQPIPAAVTACLKILSFTSPAAKTPGIFVSVESGFVVK